MRGLKVRVTAILRVADPIVVQAHRLVADVPARRAGRRTVLVDVVAHVHDEVHVFLGEILVCRVEAVLEVLTRHERELHAAWLAAGCREGPSPADRALLFARAEAIPVLAVRREIADVHVHRVRDRGPRHGHASSHDVPQARIESDFPVHRNRV